MIWSNRRELAQPAAFAGINARGMRAARRGANQCGGCDDRRQRYPRGANLIKTARLTLVLSCGQRFRFTVLSRTDCMTSDKPSGHLRDDGVRNWRTLPVATLRAIKELSKSDVKSRICGPPEGATESGGGGEGPLMRRPRPPRPDSRAPLKRHRMRGRLRLARRWHWPARPLRQRVRGV